MTEQEKCKFRRPHSGETGVRQLPGGESFYTKMSAKGYTPFEGEPITLEQYVAGLRSKFASVVVVPEASEPGNSAPSSVVEIYVMR